MLNKTHSLFLNNDCIIKNISFYSHRAESFAVYISLSIQIHSTARTVPSDFTGKPDRRVCLGSFQFSSVCVQNWPKNHLFFSHYSLACQLHSAKPFPSSQILKCFIVLKLDLELQQITSFAWGSPRSASCSNIQTVHSIHRALKTRVVPATAKVIYSRLAMADMCQPQRFPTVHTWLSCTCPFVSSSGDLPC